MAIAMLIFWIGVIFVGILLFRWLLNTVQPSSTGNSSMEVLKNRLAKGEITKEQFEELRNLLR